MRDGSRDAAAPIARAIHSPTLIAAAAMAMLGASASAREPEVRSQAAAVLATPSYEVARTSQPIEVDGTPDEAAWQAAAPMGFAQNHDGSAPPAGLETVAKVLYDDEYLYFAFENADPNIWSTFEKRDEHLWTEEVVEVFLQPDPAHPSYIELEVNPLGTMLDIFLIDVRKPIPYPSWNSHGLLWAVAVEGSVDGEPGDTHWSVEMALPLADAITAPHIPPQPGDRWRANLYRVESRPERAGLAWAPTRVRDFHRPERFGELVFVERQLP